MVYDQTHVSLDCATELVRRILNKPLDVTGMRRLSGGMVNSVLELTTGGEPERLVAKLNGEVGHKAFEREHDILLWHGRNSPLPVPHPYGFDTSGELFDGSCLLLERLPGANLAEAQLTPNETEGIEVQMAHTLAALHDLTRETYGSALQPEQDGHRRWLEVFRPRLTGEYEKAAPKLSSTARRNVERVLADLDDWLPECERPTLVHGDVWATNVIVARDAAGEPQLSGFVDGGADYADVEYELAYLLVFNTAGETFFREYARSHPLREGFELRCRVYWLNTMLVHVRAFGDRHYVVQGERLAQSLASRDPRMSRGNCPRR